MKVLQHITAILLITASFSAFAASTATTTITANIVPRWAIVIDEDDQGEDEQ